MPNQPTDNDRELIRQFLGGATEGRGDNIYIDGDRIRCNNGEFPDGWWLILRHSPVRYDTDLRVDHFNSRHGRLDIDFYAVVRSVFREAELPIPTREQSWSTHRSLRARERITRRSRPARARSSDTFEPLTRENDGI